MSYSAMQIAQSTLARRNGAPETADPVQRVKRGAVYARYSSHSQSDLSVDDQISECTAYCVTNGIELVVSPYMDRAKTGRNGNRTEFQRMLEDAKCGLFDTIVIWKFNRFFRNLNEQSIVLEELKRYGVQILAIRNPIPDGAGGVYMRAIYGADAEVYSLSLSEDIRRGIASAVKDLRSIGPQPLGYKTDEQKHIYRDEAAAAMVLQMFELYDGGGTVDECRALLNNAGYRSKKHMPYGKNAVLLMLRNVKYMGIYKHKDQLIEGGLPQIVPPELWKRVNDKLDTYKHAPQRGKAKIPYYLTTKVFCGTCGAPMYGCSGTGKSGTKYFYYECNARKQRKGCKKKPIKKDALEETVFQIALAALTDENIATIALQAEQYAVTKSDAAKRIEHINDALSLAATEIRNIGRAIAAGIITETTQQMLMDAEARRRSLQAQLQTAQADAASRLTAEDIAAWLCMFRDGKKNHSEMRRAVLQRLVMRVDVYDGGDVGDGTQQLEDGEGWVVVCCAVSNKINLAGNMFSYDGLCSTKKKPHY